MSRINSSGPYKMRSLVEFLRLYRSKSSNLVGNGNDSSVVLATSRTRIGDNNGFGSMQLAGVKFVHAARASASFSSSSGMGNSGKTTPSSPNPPRLPSPPRRGRFSTWVKIALGSIFSLLLAFSAPKWTTLLKIGGEAEVVMQEVEQVAQVVEKVANVVEKVSEEVADNLPDGNKLKEAALIVENVSKEAVKDAHIAEEILHKVDAVKLDLEEVEELVEPINHNIERDAKSDGTHNS